MSVTTRWPGGARGALSLSFDNLGEAAEIELGAMAPDAPSSATTRPRPAVLPALLERARRPAGCGRPSSSRDSTPRSTRSCCARSTRPRPRGRLPRLAPRAVGRACAPPSRPRTWPAGSPRSSELGLGGRGPAAAGRLARRGRRSTSSARPACATARRPAPGPGRGRRSRCCRSEWRHVDASLRAAAARPARASRSTGSADPVEPGALPRLASSAEIERLAERRRLLAIVLHPFMLDWLGARAPRGAARPRRRGGGGRRALGRPLRARSPPHVLASPGRVRGRHDARLDAAGAARIRATGALVARKRAAQRRTARGSTSAPHGGVAGRVAPVDQPLLDRRRRSSASRVGIAASSHRPLVRARQRVGDAVVGDVAADPQ